MVAKKQARKSAVKKTAAKRVKRKVAKVTAAKEVRTPAKPVKVHPEKTNDVAMVLHEVLNEYHDEVEARLARHVGGVREHFQHQVTVIAEQYMDLKKDMTEVKQTLVSHTEMIGQLTVDVAVLKDDVAVLKDDVTVLKTDMVEMKGDIAVLKTDVKEIKTEFAKKADRSEVAALDRRVTQLEGLAPA